jgi:hypothetical protein
MAEILKKLFRFGQKEETTKKAVTTDKVPDGGGGFSVKVAVPANSTTIRAAAPVVAQCYGNGGIQVFFRHSENASRLDSFIMEMQMFSYVPADNTTTTICAHSSCCSVLWQWWHTGFFFTLNFFQRLDSFMAIPNVPGCLSTPFHSDCFIYCSSSFFQRFFAVVM